jgi:transcriptional regulator with XRE-family HTH domain
MEIREYVEKAKEALGNVSDNALARYLGVTSPSVNHYKHGQTFPDLYARIQLSRLLQLDPLLVILDIEIQREKNEERRKIWIDVLTKAHLNRPQNVTSEVTPSPALPEKSP